MTVQNLRMGGMAVGPDSGLKARNLYSYAPKEARPKGVDKGVVPSCKIVPNPAEEFGSVLYGVGPVPSCAQALAAWLDDQAAAWSAGSLRNHRYRLGLFLERFGGLPLQSVTTEHLGELRRLLLEQGKSRSWISQVRTDMHAFFAWAMDRGYLKESPYRMKLWTLPNAKKEEAKVRAKYRHYEREEIERLCAHLPPPLVRFTWLACLSGFRISTLAALDTSMVQGDWVVVPPQFVKQGVELRLFLSPKIKAVLGPITPGKLLKELPTCSWINKELKRAGAAAGVKDPHLLHAHQFRRTWVYWMVQAGAKREEVMQIQRWSSEHVLIVHYFPDLNPQRQVELAARL